MELTLTRQTPAQHIVWLDVVRLVAIVYSSLLAIAQTLLTSIRAHRPTLLTSSSGELSTVRRSVLAYRFLNDYRCIAVAGTG